MSGLLPRTRGEAETTRAGRLVQAALLLVLLPTPEMFPPYCPFRIFTTNHLALIHSFPAPPLTQVAPVIPARAAVDVHGPHGRSSAPTPSSAPSSSPLTPQRSSVTPRCEEMEGAMGARFEYAILFLSSFLIGIFSLLFVSSAPLRIIRISPYASCILSCSCPPLPSRALHLALPSLALLGGVAAYGPEPRPPQALHLRVHGALCVRRAPRVVQLPRLQRARLLPRAQVRTTHSSSSLFILELKKEEKNYLNSIGTIR